MQKIIFESYRKYQKESDEGLIKAIFKLPIAMIIFLVTAIIAAFLSIICLFLDGLRDLIPICVIIEAVICVTLYFYSENYNMKNSSSRKKEYYMRYSQVVCWLTSIGVVVNENNISGLKERYVKEISSMEEERKENRGRAERWIQVVIFPILLAVFTEIIEGQKEIKVIISYAIVLIMYCGIVIFIVNFILQYTDFFKKRKVEQLRSLVNDLQGVLDTQLDDKLIDVTEIQNGNVEQSKRRKINFFKVKTREKLIKEFPKIDDKSAEEMDVNIKAKIITYQATDIMKYISNYIQGEVKKYAVGNNKREIRKKCEKLSQIYIEENSLWSIQENWFGILAYLLTYATMIARITELNTKCNDGLMIIIYFVALTIWSILVKIKRSMSENVQRFMCVFNSHTPSILFISTLLFYICVISCPYKAGWIITLVLTFGFCVYVNIRWYIKSNKRK